MPVTEAQIDAEQIEAWRERLEAAIQCGSAAVLKLDPDYENVEQRSSWPGHPCGLPISARVCRELVSVSARLQCALTVSPAWSFNAAQIGQTRSILLDSDSLVKLCADAVRLTLSEEDREAWAGLKQRRCLVDEPRYLPRQDELHLTFEVCLGATR